MIKIDNNTILKETAIEFSKRVDDLVWKEDIPYLEALNEITIESHYEPERVAKLLTPDLKAKIQYEAENLSLVVKSGNNRLEEL